MLRFRPRLTFSLRTFLALVTIVGGGCGYVGRQWRIVQIRNELNEWPFDNWGFCASGDRLRIEFAGSYQIPWLRRQLGEQSCGLYSLEGYFTREQLALIRSACPEATITPAKGPSVPSVLDSD